VVNDNATSPRKSLLARVRRYRVLFWLRVWHHSERRITAAFDAFTRTEAGE